jgi:hypothetical protein
MRIDQSQGPRETGGMLWANENQRAWLHVYAAILAALVGNDANRYRLEDMRELAEQEANIACRKIGVAL